jgi:hypothetical protein
MPAGLQAQHDLWRVRQVSMDELSRGQLLADAMVRAGDDPDMVERQLLAAGIAPLTAEVVTQAVRDDAPVTSRSAAPDR